MPPVWRPLKRTFSAKGLRGSGLSPLILVLTAWGILNGCGQDALEFRQSGTGLHYRMTSGTGLLPPGRRATFLVGDCSAQSCGTFASIYQAFSAVADAQGAVPVDFVVPHAENDWIYLTAYLDVNDSGAMDAGDWVWGTNPASFTGYGRVSVLQLFFFLAAVR